MVDFIELLRLLRPHQAYGVGKLRLGNLHDGGYVLLDDFIGIDAVLGCGVGWDVSFEYALAERGIAVHLYDHTVDGTPSQHENFHFYKRRIGATPADDAESFDAAAAAIATAPQRSLLKMDIEGDEWAIFAAARPNTLQGFRQIVCELHDFAEYCDMPWRLRAHAALTNLMRDFAVVHVHANNFGHTVSRDGKAVPTVLEVTLANRRCYALAPGSETFPTPFDGANNDKAPDIPLGHFTF